MLTTILLRYVGTILQFILLAVIARSVGVEDYGLYMLCLSLTFSYYYVVGLGSSEAAVARISHDMALGDDSKVGQTVGSVLILALVTASCLICLALLTIWIHPFSGGANVAAAFVMVFLASNGIIFNVAQLLLALGKSSLGSFFFYPAINLSLLFTTVPVALVVDDVTFAHITLASMLGSSVAAALAIAICLLTASRWTLTPSVAQMVELVRQGVGMTLVRILHVASFWIPTMVAGFMMSPTDAGLIGTAGRLAIAVSAVIAAVRFVIRPTISRAIAKDRLQDLRRLAGSVAFVTTSLAILALIAHLLVGESLIRIFFGVQIAQAAPILTIMLLSVCAEAVFGPVDEILKLVGAQRAVTWVYGVGVMLFLAGSIFATQVGLIWIAWLQVFYVLGIFLAMNLIVRQRLGFFLFPQWPDMGLLKNVR